MERQYVDGRVSVITPVFNAEKYLKEMIQSVIAQSYSEMELILVDDCSVDGSAKIIEDFQKKYQNIVYYKQPKNMGAGAARNKCLELATGQYVAFLDSDDVWLPEKTTRQLQLMEKENSPFSYAAIEMIDENNETIKTRRRIPTSCDYNFLLKNTVIATSSVIVDRNVLGDFRMPLRRGGQDYATWLSLLRNGTVACGLDETMVKYRVSSGSLSSNKLKSVKQVWEIQTQDEGINKISAAIHVLCFSFNALKKYLL